MNTFLLDGRMIRYSSYSFFELEFPQYQLQLYCFWFLST